MTEVRDQKPLSPAQVLHKDWQPEMFVKSKYIALHCLIPADIFKEHSLTASITPMISNKLKTTSMCIYVWPCFTAD